MPQDPIQDPVLDLALLLDSSKGALLIADDDRMQRKLVQAILKQRPLEAKNGAEALALAYVQRPDVVILDRNLPDINGLKVIKALKADRWTRDAPVVFLSAYDTEEETREGIDAGAMAYVSKAKVMTSLKIQIEEALKRARSRPESNPLTLLPGVSSLRLALSESFSEQSPFAVLHVHYQGFAEWTLKEGWLRCGQAMKALAARLYALYADSPNNLSLCHVSGMHFVLVGPINAISRVRTELSKPESPSQLPAIQSAMIEVQRKATIQELSNALQKVHRALPNGRALLE